MIADILALLGFSKRLMHSHSAWRLDKDYDRRAMVTVLVDDVDISVHQGECLAVALAISGFSTLRHSPEAGTPRGMFCLMGSCQECLVHVDGVPAVACMEPVRPGMRVTLDQLTRERSGGPGH